MYLKWVLETWSAERDDEKITYIKISILFPETLSFEHFGILNSLSRHVEQYLRLRDCFIVC